METNRERAARQQKEQDGNMFIGCSPMKKNKAYGRGDLNKGFTPKSKKLKQKRRKKNG